MKNSYSQLIIVEGPIGVGKTTLARKLANSLGYQTFLEKYEHNPFLISFYKDVEKYALSTQISFLLQRATEFGVKNNKKFRNNLVSDFFIQKDTIFARNILTKDEFNLYNSIYQKLEIVTPKPSLVIYLQADLETLLERIKKRNNDFECYITPEYLKKINDAYTDFFYSYKDSPLLIINTSSVDVNSNNDYSLLLSEIKKDLKGRNFFYPSSLKEI